MKVLSEHSSGHSEFSDPIVVRVPVRPPKPILELEPIIDVGQITSVFWTVDSVKLIQNRTKLIECWAEFVGKT